MTLRLNGNNNNSSLGGGRSSNNACDDGGFEEVSLAEDGPVTPVNEFSEFNRQFPMTCNNNNNNNKQLVVGPIRKKKMSLPVMGFWSSGTEASMMVRSTQDYARVQLM